MGSFSRPFEQQMSSDNMIVAIQSEAERVKNLALGTRWYIFGSFIRNPRRAADVDILILCKSQADVRRVRDEALDICSEWPLHLLLMTEAEEQETNFIASGGCVLLAEHLISEI